MSQTANQSEPVRNQTDHPEDEIELIDLLRVIWKWKYLIIGGTLVCAIAAMIISSIMPKIYRIETLIRPGILSFSEAGKNLYIDTPDNIKALIEAGALDLRILDNLAKSYGANIPNMLKFKVTLPKGSDTLKINYETSQIEQGTQILDFLGKFLIEEYSNFVENFQNKIDRDLNIAKAEIQKSNSIKHSNEININIIEKRIHELEIGIVDINENITYLNKERNKLLLEGKNESNILSTILYSNTIQQNLQFVSDYKSQIQDLKNQKENELQNISELENKIQIQIAEINNLEFKKNNIQNIRIIQKPYSSKYPIKPKKMLYVILAGFVGIFAMFFLAFLLEYISRNKERRYL
jgi:LPS O-antigen subunit length determinant protein (WzzB/FepE family)